MDVSAFSRFVLYVTALALQGLAPFLGRRTTPTTDPFYPTAANLVFNTTVPQGVRAVLGWTDTIIPGIPPSTNVFDGSARNLTMFYTPPGGVETYRGGFFNGPRTDFCGVTPGATFMAYIDSSVLGTYTGRWVVEFGQSTDPDAPVDPKTGCGPLPFTTNGVEFVRTWEVVAA
ncbi:hypothetical protein MSAN_02128200 [Mycena sanguinolenta]|uniref:Uncharacterized protein n=1 Tax=Mycena sanguinolenta TaxID=230812 RepID=A0A8H6XHF1_9AGAR|nr:hypothetical protein MSAN_02128200 [Mycena sanguinolenta]